MLSALPQSPIPFSHTPLLSFGGSTWLQRVLNNSVLLKGTGLEAAENFVLLRARVYPCRKMLYLQYGFSR